jgi:hypothetical protein
LRDYHRDCDDDDDDDDDGGGNSVITRIITVLPLTATTPASRNITSSTNCKNRTVPTLYTLEAWFVEVYNSKYRAYR